MPHQTCAHTTWFVVEKSTPRDSRLCMTDRFQRLREHLTIINPKRQSCIPGIWLFLGRHSRAYGARSMFGQRCSGKPQLGSTIELYLPARRAFSDHPVLLAQGDLAPSQWTDYDFDDCHQVRTKRIDLGAEDSDSTPMDLLYGGFLANYCEVCCVFCANYDEQSALDRLVCWLRIGAVNTTSYMARPHLLLITDEKTSRLSRDFVVQYLAERSSHEYTIMFSGITVIAVRHEDVSMFPATYTSVEGPIANAARHSRQLRQSMYLNFTMPSLSSLWQLHITHLQATSMAKFDVARALRPQRPVSPELSWHITSLLQLYKSETMLRTDVRLLGTILFKDHAVATIHRKSTLTELHRGYPQGCCLPTLCRYRWHMHGVRIQRLTSVYRAPSHYCFCFPLCRRL